MADVHVSVLNLSGNTVTLLLDDERPADVERIAYLRTLKRRDELDDVTVTPAKPPRAKPGPKPGA